MLLVIGMATSGYQKEVDKIDATRDFGNMQGVPALGDLGRKLAGDIWVK